MQTPSTPPPLTVLRKIEVEKAEAGAQAHMEVDEEEVAEGKFSESKDDAESKAAESKEEKTAEAKLDEELDRRAAEHESNERRRRNRRRRMRREDWLSGRVRDLKRKEEARRRLWPGGKRPKCRRTDLPVNRCLRQPAAAGCWQHAAHACLIQY